VQGGYSTIYELRESQRNRKSFLPLLQLSTQRVLEFMMTINTSTNVRTK